MEDRELVQQSKIEKNQLHKILIRGEERKRQQEEGRLDQQIRELDSLNHLYEEDARQQKERLNKREKEVEELREKLRVQQYVGEKKLQKERETRDAFFAERDQKLMRRQSEFEQLLAQREQEVESLRSHLTAEVSQREANLKHANLELQQEKDRYNQENRERLDRTSKKYVEDALASLHVQETKFHKSSENWSAIGAGALIVGLVLFAVMTLTSLLALPAIITWEFIVFSVAKGLIAVSLLAALARYAFLFSNSYVREALKNADRRHAINFGKFYLESYGAAADWSQVKEAFEHWNIGGSNAFSKPDEAQFDVSAIGKAATLLEQFGKSFSNPKAGETS